MLWWRKMWDISYCISSSMIALMLGLILGNVLMGIPIDAQGNFTGSAFYFLNPYAIMVAVTTLALFMMHGAIFLVMKTENRLYAKLTILVKNTTIFFVVSILVLSFYTLLYVPHLSGKIRHNGWMFCIPIGMVLSIANITRQITKRKYLLAFLSSALTVSLLFIIVAIELYPNLLISTTNRAYTLTVHNASSSTKSLQIMLIFVAIGVPLALFYTSFVFWTFKGKVKLNEMSY